MLFTESFHHLVALLWPYRCLVCERGLARTEVCSGCLPTLPAIQSGEHCFLCWSALLEKTPAGRCGACEIFRSPFRFARFLWRYTDQIRTIIRIIKYRPSRRLCLSLAHHVAQTVGTLFPLNDWDLIVPMPASIASFRSRGFNQCDIVAQIVGSVLKVSLESRALTVVRSKAAQASLPLDQRTSNVRGVFRAEAHRLMGKRCLLIDDVATTGATSTAAGVTLLKNGARSVDLFTVARGDAWGEYRAEVHRKIGRTLSAEVFLGEEEHPRVF